MTPQGKQNPSPSSAVADDKKALEEKEAATDSVKASRPMEAYVILRETLTRWGRSIRVRNVEIGDYDKCPKCEGENGEHVAGCAILIALGELEILAAIVTETQRVLSSPGVSSPATSVASENWTGIPDSEVCHCGELIAKHDQLQGCNNPRPLASPASSVERDKKQDLGEPGGV